MQFEFRNSKEIDSQLPVVNLPDNFIQVIDAVDSDFVEYNPDVQIEDGANSFWNSIEMEMKYTIQMNPIEWFNSLPQKFESQYSFSTQKKDTTFERYFEVAYQNKNYALTKLGKRNWKRKVGLKYKTSVQNKNGLLERKMVLIEYSEENFKLTTEKLLECKFEDAVIVKYPAFYKHKYRYICLNKTNGFIFGLSLDSSVPLKNKRSGLYQVELEYWSRIVPKGIRMNNEIYHKEVLEEFITIKNLLTHSLTEAQIKFDAAQVTKFDWIKRLKNDDDK